MKSLLTPLLYLALAAPLFAAEKKEPSPDDQYKKLTPDSEEQPGVPKGTLTEHEWNDSKIFPGTVRKYSVYVPKQYDGKTPACVYVSQDGVLYKAPTVFDNLIHKKEMPVTIGIFIRPGTKPLKPGEVAPKRPDGRPAPPSNRSFEYDSLGDQYARFLLEEILPEVGKKYNLTTNPEGRAIGGASSGGICSWTVCWERPDQFRKAFTTIGSYTNIRGGHVYPALIRKTERKPIRVSVQSGVDDVKNQFGDWPLANKQMATALKFAGYDHRFDFGEGAHNSKHGGSIFPEVMKWLWRDSPK